MKKQKTTKKNHPLTDRRHIFLIAHPLGMYATGNGGKTVFPEKAFKFKSEKLALADAKLWGWKQLHFTWIKEFMADGNGKLLWLITTKDLNGISVNTEKLLDDLPIGKSPIHSTHTFRLTSKDPNITSLPKAYKDKTWKEIDRAVVDEMHRRAGTKSNRWVIRKNTGVVCNGIWYWDELEACWVKELENATIYSSFESAQVSMRTWNMTSESKKIGPLTEFQKIKPEDTIWDGPEAPDFKKLGEIERIKKEAYQCGYRDGLEQAGQTAFNLAKAVPICSCGMGKKHSCPVHGSGVQ